MREALDALLEGQDPAAGDSAGRLLDQVEGLVISDAAVVGLKR